MPDGGRACLGCAHHVRIGSVCVSTGTSISRKSSCVAEYNCFSTTAVLHRVRAWHIPGPSRLFRCL